MFCDLKIKSVNFSHILLTDQQMLWDNHGLEILNWTMKMAFVLFFYIYLIFYYFLMYEIYISLENRKGYIFYCHKVSSFFN